MSNIPVDPGETSADLKLASIPTGLNHGGPGSSADETGEVIDSVYLPFLAATLRQHFAPVAGRSDNELANQVNYFLNSARRYAEFRTENSDLRGRPLQRLKQPCQIEKDEKFWTAACWMTLFHHPDRVPLFERLMGRCFGDVPPLRDVSTWRECFTGRLHLFFEATLPSPQAYKHWLAKHIAERNLIPYVRAAATRSGSNFEGGTHADAMLLNEDNGFALLVEAKVASDVSCDVSFDLLRNQLARCIDVALERNEFLARPLSRRDPSKTLLILQTPALFRENPTARLYGWLFRQYSSNPATLAQELQHRKDVDWSDVSKRLGWLTWEDCADVEPNACRWLQRTG